MKRGGYFGSQTRAADGCIVTFKLPDGSVLVEAFRQVLHSTFRAGLRKTVVDGEPYIVQAVARADDLSAKIVCISTPQTILTDMQGTRAMLNAKPVGLPGIKGGMQQGPANFVGRPEIQMLGKIKRLDLLAEQEPNGQPSQNIRQVHQRRPSHTGPREQ